MQRKHLNSYITIGTAAIYWGLFTIMHLWTLQKKEIIQAEGFITADLFNSMVYTETSHTLHMAVVSVFI